MHVAPSECVSSLPWKVDWDLVNLPVFHVNVCDLLSKNPFVIAVLCFSFLAGRKLADSLASAFW